MYVALKQCIRLPEGVTMWIIKDIIRTIREGAANGDRPMLTAMFGLLVLSLVLIAVGLAK